MKKWYSSRCLSEMNTTKMRLFCDKLAKHVEGGIEVFFNVRKQEESYYIEMWGEVMNVNVDKFLRTIKIKSVSNFHSCGHSFNFQCRWNENDVFVTLHLGEQPPYHFRKPKTAGLRFAYANDDGKLVLHDYWMLVTKRDYPPESASVMEVFRMLIRWSENDCDIRALICLMANEKAPIKINGAIIYWEDYQTEFYPETIGSQLLLEYNSEIERTKQKNKEMQDKEIKYIFPKLRADDTWDLVRIRTEN